MKCDYFLVNIFAKSFNSNDEFSILARKPLDSLFDSLQFCIDYVAAQSACASHNIHRCLYFLSMGQERASARIRLQA